MLLEISLPGLMTSRQKQHGEGMSTRRQRAEAEIRILLPVYIPSDLPLSTRLHLHELIYG